MSNSIVGKSDPKTLMVRMNNGATDVVIALLVMSGSENARRLSEIELSVSLAAKDQSIYGRGCIGFDIRDLPWAIERTEFQKDKEFLLKVVRIASNGSYSDRLDYEPGLEFIRSCFEDLQLLLKELEYEDINDKTVDRKLMPQPPYRKCETHGCYLHQEGCVICNSM